MLHQGVDARQILREDGPDLSCTRQMSPTLQRSRHIRHRWCLLEERQQRKPHQQWQPPRLLEWCQLLKQGVFTNRLFPVQAKPKADDAHCTQTQIRMPLNGLERVKRAFRFSHSLSPRGLLVSLPHMPKKPPRSCPHLCSYLPFRGGQHYSEGIHGPPSGEGHRPSPDIQAPALANQVCVSDSMSGVDDPPSPSPDRQ
jgi:hypothetical protein